VKMLFVL